MFITQTFDFIKKIEKITRPGKVDEYEISGLANTGVIPHPTTGLFNPDVDIERIKGDNFDIKLTDDGKILDKDIYSRFLSFNQVKDDNDLRKLFI